MKNYFLIGCALLVGTLLSGCQTGPKAIYQWGDYQGKVYDYFKGGSADEQIAVLEKDLEMFKAKGSSTPPGFHAHLGLLYSTVGKMDFAVQEFNTEKKLFPESTPYMDFLMNKNKKKEL